LRDSLPEIRRRGGELVIVGNGSRYFAASFREELRLDGPLLVDPELHAYRAAGLRRGRVEILSPRVPLNAVRALLRGARQHGVHGDPWQLGGVFVIRPGGQLVYRHVSREAGDHPPIDDVLAALDPDAPPVAEEAPSMLARVTGRLLTPAVDPLIPLSFGAPGFAIRSLAFEPRDLDVDLSRRRVVLTGATAGLGLEAALALADLGAELELVCRDEERGERVARRIREATGNDRVRIALADVSSLAAVRDVARALAERPVDVLIHNAGLLPASRIETEEGLELTFATHVAGPFLLTTLLRPALAAASGARVVWVSSGGMYTRRLELDDYNWERRRTYDGVIAYAETKRAQVVLAEMWADELRSDGIVVNAMHPGWADTPGVQSSLPRFRSVTRAILRTPAQGADSIVWLAASDAAGELTGEIVFDRKPRLKHVLPTTRESEADRRALWELCERLVSPFVARE
jgi:NAD(P)-dependent dehydrogenase (short-subunit alcohol dehydrogenase family)